MERKELPVLYKDKQVWACNVYNHEEFSQIVIVYGQSGGKMQTKTTLIKEGKNIGKANETGHWEQALSEAESKWNKQKDKLYHEEGEEVSNFKIRPMLAHTYDDYPHKVQFPCYGQPKLDGIRCLASKNGLFSRKGKPFKVLDHISSSLTKYFDIYPNLVLDGELYTSEINFQEIISAVKRDEKNELTDKIEYHIYDVLTDDIYERRKMFLEALSDIPFIKKVETLQINNQDEISKGHADFVQQGYEGLMLRNRHGFYKQDKRSHDLLKVKSFKDAEFPIVGVEVDKNGHPVFICEHRDTTFLVKPEGTDEERKEYLSNFEFIRGKLLTVKFFDWTSSEKPVPRFPIGLRVRDE